MQTYYDVLGVSEDAESEEIEAAFRRALASAQSEADEAETADVAARMRTLAEAYEVLSNLAYRAAYDLKREQKETVSGTEANRGIKALSRVESKRIHPRQRCEGTVRERSHHQGRLRPFHPAWTQSRPCRALPPVLAVGKRNSCPLCRRATIMPETSASSR